ncbi:MAG: hypothetical protein QOC65_768 [Sphingomonadales bacterium]|nr:hypothetical protein [Sphingomonadales bacterium]
MLAAIMFILLGSAQAGTSGPDIACILDRLPPAARDAALDEAMAGAPGPAREALLAATGACGRAGAWDDARARRSGDLAAIYLLLAQATSRLEQNGLPPDILRDWYEGQSPAVRDNLDDEALGDLVARLERAGVSRDRLEANAAMVGALFGALDGLRRAGAGSAD